MAFWKAPWDHLFARPNVHGDDDFQIVEDIDATSDFGIKSLPSESCNAVDTVPAQGYWWDEHNEALGSPSYIWYVPWDEDPDLNLPDRFPYEDERLFSTIHRSDANALELAGRHNDGHTFGDLRSAARSRRRYRTNMEKYWSYRAVNRGQLNAPHRVIHWDFRIPSVLPKDMPVRNLNKQDLFSMGQTYPRPPRRHYRDPDKARWPPKERKPALTEDEKADEMPTASDVWFMRDDLLAEHEDWLLRQLEAYIDAQAASMHDERPASPAFLVKPDRRVRALSQKDRILLSKACT